MINPGWIFPYGFLDLYLTHIVDGFFHLYLMPMKDTMSNIGCIEYFVKIILSESPLGSNIAKVEQSCR